MDPIERTFGCDEERQKIQKHMRCATNDDDDDDDDDDNDDLFNSDEENEINKRVQQSKELKKNRALIGDFLEKLKKDIDDGRIEEIAKSLQKYNENLKDSFSTFLTASNAESLLNSGVLIMNNWKCRLKEGDKCDIKVLNLKLKSNIYSNFASNSHYSNTRIQHTQTGLIQKYWRRMEILLKYIFKDGPRNLINLMIYLK